MHILKMAWLALSILTADDPVGNVMGSLESLVDNVRMDVRSWLSPGWFATVPNPERKAISRAWAAMKYTLIPQSLRL